MEFGISIGSNLGDRLERLRAARTRIVALPDTLLTACSPLYETEPVDVGPVHRDQAFLNAVLIVESAHTPAAFAAAMHAIEDALGRVRGADRNAPRPIDLDVLYAGDHTSADTTLTLPHPRWSERRFVVQPLADVRPDLRLPGVAGSVRDILLALPLRPEVLLFKRSW